MPNLTDLSLKAARCHHRLFSKGQVMGSQVAVRKRMPEVALQLSNGAWGHGGAIVLSYGSYGLRLYNCYIMYNNSLYYTYIYIYPLSG